jgi:hypothetical protein
MFLNLLDDDEKEAFAVLAGKMIEADGIVVGRELEALANLEAEIGVSEAEGADRSVDQLASVFKSRRSKFAVLLELVGLGYSDTSFNVTEQSLATAVAHEMDVSADELAGVERWVLEYVDLVQRALALMRE